MYIPPAFRDDDKEMPARDHPRGAAGELRYRHGGRAARNATAPLP